MSQSTGETSDITAFVGEPGRPSEHCLYLLTPLRDGTATADDRQALLTHTDGCTYCRAELNAHYRQGTDEGAA